MPKLTEESIQSFVCICGKWSFVGKNDKANHKIADKHENEEGYHIVDIYDF